MTMEASQAGGARASTSSIRASWRNWSGNVAFNPAAIASPTSIDDVAETVRTTTGRIRTVGSGHSFTSLAHTDGTLVTLAALPGAVVDTDPESMVATLNAGASLHSLSEAMQAEGLAFKNLGDIDVQSLAGATSTATHGTGRTLPCLSAEIAGVRLVTATGDVLDIKAETNTELLPAVQVALGSLGVIVEADVRVRPAFSLHRRTMIEPLADTFSAANRRWDEHRNYEFFYLPFCDHAFNITHDETDEAERRVGSADDEAALRDLRRLRTTMKHLPRVRRRILNEVAKRTSTEDVVGASWQLLASDRRSIFNEMEYHVPVERGLDALAEVIAAVEKNPSVYFPVECRRTAGDDAWLSPFQGEERISIAVHIGEGDDYRWLFDVIEPILRRHGGRPHWGKLHSLKADDLRELYPDFDRFAAVRSELDPTGRFLNPHTAALWGQTFDG